MHSLAPTSRGRIAFFGFVLLVSSGLHCASLPVGAAGRCDRFADKLPPARDLPTEADRARLDRCDTSTLYFGIERAPDPTDARLCAMIELEKGDPTGLPLHDAGILVGIYANGKGVTRNAALAKHYACVQTQAYGSVDSLFERIDRAVAGAEEFDGCADAAGGLAADECALVQYLVELSRAHEDQRKLLQWAGAQPNFTALKSAALAYERTRIPVEVERLDHLTNQTWRRTVFVEQLNAVLSALKDGASGVPSADLEQRDRELNAVYKRVLREATQRAKENSLTPEMLQPGQLRAVERAWLAYADACEQFRMALGSTLSPTALRRLLVSQRIEALRAMFFQVGVDEEMEPIKY
jgi:uncharacterized protein YecT (DUF1311 family)